MICPRCEGSDFEEKGDPHIHSDEEVARTLECQDCKKKLLSIYLHEGVFDPEEEEYISRR